MKNQRILLISFIITIFMFLACSKDEVVNDIVSTNNVSIGHTDDTLGISIVAVNATASVQNTNVNVGTGFTATVALAAIAR